MASDDRIGLVTEAWLHLARNHRKQSDRSRHAYCTVRVVLNSISR